MPCHKSTTKTPNKKKKKKTLKIVQNIICNSPLLNPRETWLSKIHPRR